MMPIVNLNYKIYKLWDKIIVSTKNNIASIFLHGFVVFFLQNLFSKICNFVTVSGLNSSALGVLFCFFISRAVGSLFRPSANWSEKCCAAGGERSNLRPPK